MATFLTVDHVHRNVRFARQFYEVSLCSHQRDKRFEIKKDLFKKRGPSLTAKTVFFTVWRPLFPCSNPLGYRAGP